MLDDILEARIVVARDGGDLSGPVFADFRVKLSSRFNERSIEISFFNEVRAGGRNRFSQQSSVRLKRDDADGVYKRRLELSTFSPTGEYRIVTLRATDIAGKELFIPDNDDLIELGLTDTRFNFVNSLESDINAPIIEAVASSLTEGPDGDFQLDVSFKIFDDLSGVGFTNETDEDDLTPGYNNAQGDRSYRAFLRNVGDQQISSGFFAGSAQVSMAPNPDGSFSGTARVLLGKNAPSGDYELTINAADRAGNILGNVLFEGNNLRINLNNENSDTIGPELRDLIITGSFDPVTLRPVINYNGFVADDKSGVQDGFIDLIGANGVLIRSFGGLNLDSTGFFDKSVFLPIPFISGRYTASATLFDNAENRSDFRDVSMISIISPANGLFGEVSTGTVENEIVFGTPGNDKVDGGGGIDELVGGLGNDFYVIDNVSDKITEEGNQGSDTVQTTISYSIATLDNVENIALTGTASVNAIGNASANSLAGNSAGNILDGGAGIDQMAGGLGNDIYRVDTPGDIITEATTGGIDTVETSSTYTLGINVENLMLMGSTAINGTGNASTNNLTGNSANNILDGGAGIDQMAGGLGSDTYIVDNSRDKITEAASAGIDTVQTTLSYTVATSPNLENITLIGTAAINAAGNGASNTLIGNSSSNLLTGGLGADILTGGLGTDTFRFALADSRLSALDLIRDFVIGTDRIDGPRAVSAVNTKELGAVASLDQAGISALLTSSVFGSNQAATFTFISGTTARTFLAINDGVAGFSSTSDSVIEITGFSGQLTNLAIV